MRALLLLASALCALAADGPVEAKPFRMGKRTLIITQNADMKNTHGRFLGQFTARKHDVTIKSATERVDIIEYGKYLFDNIVLMAPSAKNFAGLDAESIISFVDKGGNLLVAGDADVSPELRRLASEFGVDYDAAGSRVIDHLSHHSSDSGSHEYITTNEYYPSKFLVGDLAGANAPAVVYSGTGMSVSDANILAVKTLTAEHSGYSTNPAEAVKLYPQSAGSETVLVASVQARNNARATFTGSLWMLSDAAFALSSDNNNKVGNKAFATAIAKWTFQETGVLRAKNLRHRHQDGSPAERQVAAQEKADLPLSMFPQPEIARNSLVYRINDDIEFAVDVELYSNGEWVPYVADDMQLEFVMLDPYVRKALTANEKGQFLAQFKVPDTYGIYNFRVMYRRPGLTVLNLKEQVSVRPFRHDEYERFITAAYPYYTSAFAMMAGVFIFSFLFLFSSPLPAVAKPAVAEKAKTS